MSHFTGLIQVLKAHAALVRSRAREDGGYSTETVVVTALLSVLGLTVIGIIVTKVIAKANGIAL